MAERDIHIPSTVSDAAQKLYRDLREMKFYGIDYPSDPTDREGWRKVHDEMASDPELKAANDGIVDLCDVSVAAVSVGGVPVIDIRPNRMSDSRAVLVHAHGGAFTLYGASNFAGICARLSAATGLRVVSVDYTTAPFADWKEIQAEVLSVVTTLCSEGRSLKEIALFGDSAGGGLAVSTVLNMRDQGVGMPAAVLLWSPWVDLTNEGDSAYTLRDADPVLTYDGLLVTGARAFANGLDLKDPRVSPLYADFSRGFPPTLIQEGTKTTFLSTSVRLYQALEAAGAEPVIDMYEGMFHGFQYFQIPEADCAIRKSAKFITRCLR